MRSASSSGSTPASAGAATHAQRQQRALKGESVGQRRTGRATAGLTRVLAARRGQLHPQPPPTAPVAPWEPSRVSNMWSR